MKVPTGYLVGAAVTAAMTYFFDPRSGRRRRAMLRDRATQLAVHADGAARVAARDLAHRAQGIAARTRSAFAAEGATQDEVLMERVRASLGRVVSHPGAIDVEAHDGYVTLSGAVLTNEHGELLRCVANTRGVEGLDDRLAVHESAAGISELQGGKPRRPARFELMQENWSPAARLLTGIAGAALAVGGLRRRGLLGLAVAGAGGVLLARSATNVPLAELVGRRGVITVRKRIHVHAPIEDVFQTLEDHENFPFFMRNVRQVQNVEHGTSHWTVAGPAGASVEWDAETTVHEPYRTLAWRTLPNSRVAHEGVIRLHSYGLEGTRLEVEMCYCPPAGVLGHAVARLFGADPKTELDEDLVRLKTFIETGKPARDAAVRNVPTLEPSL